MRILLMFNKSVRRVVYALSAFSLLILGLPAMSFSQPSISFDLDCSQGPGQARLEVESPLGGDWSYALNDGDFQASVTFSDIFPGNHILIVRNTSGDRDTVSFNTNCGLEQFSCSDCDRSGTFFQVYTQNGVIAGLDLETNQFSSLPNSPAGFHINATGLNPKDSLAYGIKRNNSNELIIVDATGRAINLGEVTGLPISDYTSGDFDSDGYLHIKQGFSNSIYKINVKEGEVEENYFLDAVTRSNDIAYSAVNDLFYLLDNDGRLFSFSQEDREVILVGSSGLSGQVGAMYCDRSGKVFGIINNNGRLYEFDTSDASPTFIMVTNSASYNDGFSCQTISFNEIPTPAVELECSTDSGVVDLNITEPRGDDFEFSVNSSSYQNRRYWSGLAEGSTEIIVRKTESCLADTLMLNISAMFHTEDFKSEETCEEFISASGIRWDESGTYRDTVSNTMGCDSVITYDITILESSESSQSIETCDTYAWNGMMLDSSGVYEFITTNEVGCDSIARLDLTLTAFLDTQFSVATCRPVSSPDGEELWTESGVFVDTLTSILGCDSIITIDLQIGDVLADWQLMDPTCPDHLVSWLQIDTISHQGPHYMIRNEMDTVLISSTPIEITDLPPGENRIQFVSSDSCESPVSTIQVEELELPEIRLIGPAEIDVCDPPTLYQLETNMPGDFQWYSNSSLQCDTCSSTEVFSYQEGVIGVDFIAENDCAASDEIQIKLTGLDVQYFIPNVFSPNGDGVNDYFTLFTGRGEVDQIELMQIYDRWGNQLFERQNFNPSIESLGWDGSFRGRPMSIGVYAYQIIYKYCDGSRHRIHGSVTLVK